MTTTNQVSQNPTPRVSNQLHCFMTVVQSPPPQGYPYLRKWILTVFRTRSGM